MQRTLFFFLLTASVWSAHSGFNFYISLQEATRVLGLEAELAYVRDGRVSDVAQHFTVPVPATINELCFVWVNHEPKTVRYWISLRGVLSLNISERGLVPRTAQTFCVSLPCPPSAPPSAPPPAPPPASSSTSVDAAMKITFTAHNVTSLNVLMRKECAHGDVLTRVMVTDDPSHMTYVAVGVAFAVLLVTLTAVAIFFCPKRGTCFHARPAAAVHGCAVYTSVQTSCPAEEVRADGQVDGQADGQADAPNPLYLQRSDVCVGATWLEGTFGVISKAALRTERAIVDVTVKTVKENAADNQIQLMVQEGTQFQSLAHPNVCPLLGIVDGDGGKPLLVYPRVSHGNLKKWLLQCRGSLDGNLPHPLCTQDLVTIALQVLQGLEYLHQHNVVHKDLATRNCVIDEHFHVKVTDTALSRDLFPADYHCLGDNENRPIKWMAIESLARRGDFSPASDVWSFGVVLWEVTTLAQQPFVEVDPFEVGRVLHEGYRLTQPINCPDELYSIMAFCWTVSGRERPTAAQLYRELHKFHQQLNEYI